jgi:hypothetical protein
MGLLSGGMSCRELSKGRKAHWCLCSCYSGWKRIVIDIKDQLSIVCDTEESPASRLEASRDPVRASNASRVMDSVQRRAKR